MKKKIIISISSIIALLITLTGIDIFLSLRTVDIPLEEYNKILREADSIPSQVDLSPHTELVLPPDPG